MREPAAVAHQREPRGRRTVAFACSGGLAYATGSWLGQRASTTSLAPSPRSGSRNASRFARPDSRNLVALRSTVTSSLGMRRCLYSSHRE
jgi:hypothetical protein